MFKKKTKKYPHYEFTIEGRKTVCTYEPAAGLKFIGKARCHADDEFNASSGRKIAKSKADIKSIDFTIRQMQKEIADLEILKQIQEENIQNEIINAEVYAARLRRLRKQSEQ